MTGVTGSSASQISATLQDSMGGTGAVGVTIKVGNVTCCTNIRLRPIRIGAGANQGGTANSTQVTKSAVTRVDSSHNRTLRRGSAGATRTMTGLAGS